MMKPWSLVIAMVLAGTRPAWAEPTYEYKDVEKPTVIVIEKPTVWRANASGGAVWVTGNTKSIGLSGTGVFGVKHWNNEFTLSGGGAWVQSGVSKFGKGGPITDETTSVENWLGKARYDRYFLSRNTVYVSFQASGDRPAGYIYRLEPQVGYARLLWKSVHQLFRGEIGYDYTREHRVVQPMPDLPRNVDYHSGRLFLYYENKFTPYATFTEGLELLEAFNRLEGFRLNNLTTLSSQIYKSVALKLNFKLMFNNDPAARPAPTNIDPATGMLFVLPPDQTRFDKVDTQLDLVLAVTFL